MFCCCFCIKLVQTNETWVFNHVSALLTKSLYFKIPISQPFSSISAAANENQQHPPCKFTVVDYLINSCSLSPETALSASKKLNIKTPEKPNSVLTFLTDYGFNKTHIKDLITKRPLILTASVDKILKPKFQFFLDLGLSLSNLPELIVGDPSFLSNCNLKSKIKPTIDLLRGFLHTNENVITAIKRCQWLLTADLDKYLVPKVSILETHGIPKSYISKSILMNPRIFLLKTDKFNEIIVRVKEFGFDSRAPTMFMGAAVAICSVSRSAWKARIEGFRRWGWSDMEIVNAFKKHPPFMRCSEKKIRRVMDFFVKEMNWRPSELSTRPSIFRYNLETRVIPRCRVVKVLTSKNLIKNKLEPVTFISISEDKFLERYVIRHQERVPDLLNAYQGMVGAIKG